MVSVDFPSGDDVVSPLTIQMIGQLRSTESASTGLAEQITKQLESAVTVGILVQGDKLPPENSFAEQLGVSPITLRQALATLRMQGLIDTRRGRGGGSYIRASGAPSEAVLRQQVLEYSPDELRDICDLASSIAAGTGRRAALRADEQDLRRARALAGRFAASSTSSELRRTDSRFHISLGVASQSRRLTNAIVQMQGELAALMWIHDTSPSSINNAASEHEEILNAIENRDDQAAAELSSSHFERESEMLISFYLQLATGQSENP